MTFIPTDVYARGFKLKHRFKHPRDNFAPSDFNHPTQGFHITLYDQD
jgi:hypothetical protein